MFIPKKVQEMLTDIEDNLGFAPQLDRIDGRHFRITIANDRVHCTVDYKFTGNRWDWHGSKLTVDGQRIALMPNPAAFYRLYRNPDTLGLEPADLAILADLQPIEHPHPTLQTMADYLGRRLAPLDSAATVGLVLYNGQPSVLVEMTKATMLWVLSGESVRLGLFALDGLDLTGRFKDLTQIEEMFGIIAESYGVTLTTPDKDKHLPPQFSSEPKSISNAVRTRKQTVIRT